MPRNNKDIKIAFAKRSETQETDVKKIESKNYSDGFKDKRNISNAETLEELKKIYAHIENIYSILNLLAKR